jgi:DNA-binding transcriptional ArsR family regulator
MTAHQRNCLYAKFINLWIALIEYNAWRCAVAESLDELKAEFFRSMAHPARIRILELLVVQDRSVTELLPAVGLEASNLSQQLTVLRRAGIVSARRQSNAVTYSVTSPHIAALLTVARTVLSGRLDEQAGALGISAVDAS